MEQEAPQKNLRTKGSKKLIYQIIIFTLTYTSYALMHFTREAWAILKSDVRSQDFPGLSWEHNNNAGVVDFSFLIFYSIGLFISGVLGDNYPIRIIVPIGYMIVSIMIVMISLGGIWQITSVYYYIVFFSISGLWQSIGWPSFVAVMGNWFSKDSRGLIFGIWWTWQNVGNIGGNILANFLRIVFGMSWMWNFWTVGIMVGIIGILNLLLLVDHPIRKGIIIEQPNEEVKEFLKRIHSQKLPQKGKELQVLNSKENSNTKQESNLADVSSKKQLKEENFKSEREEDYGTIIEEFEEAEEERHAISFWKAWLLPGVIQYSLCIAFVKLSTYGMLFWLPTYATEELAYSRGDVEFIAVAFDVGTIFGSILLGLLTDLTYKKRSPVAFSGLIIGTILFLAVVIFSDSAKFIIFAIIFLVGFFVGGIFNIVAATVAADLAKGKALKGNDKALATVSGILDGSGSLGAAFGSLIIGRIAETSWPAVFIFLAWAVFVSSLPMLRILFKEVPEIIDIRNRKQLETCD